MLPLLILALVAGPLVEIAVTAQILVWAPWPLVLAVVLLGSLTGIVVLRQHGLAHLQRWRTARRRGAPAGIDTVTEGLRDVAGILLAVPGIVTTVVGLVLLAYPLRRFIAKRSTAAGTARRRRRVPSTTPSVMPALAPPPPRPELQPVGAAVESFQYESTTWDPAPVGATGYIAGQSDLHGAVADDFFEAEGVAGGVAGREAVAVPHQRVAPPPALMATPQTSGWSPGSGAPVPPRPPEFAWSAPEAASPPPGDPLPVATDASTVGGDWDGFMAGRDWEEGPERTRRGGKRRRRAKRGEATPEGGE